MNNLIFQRIRINKKEREKGSKGGERGGKFPRFKNDDVTFYHHYYFFPGM